MVTLKNIKKMSVAMLMLPFGTFAHTPKTVAVLPFHFINGESEPMHVVKKTAKDLFESIGFTVWNESDSKVIWEKQLKRKLPEHLATNKDLVDLGKELNADYACSAVVKWVIKTPWVLFGPKTKAECTIDFKLVDVKTHKTVLEREKVMADSTKHESGWEVAGSLLVYPIFTLVSGGPKTPHMNRSGQIAMMKVLEPFLDKIHKEKNK